MLNFHYLSTLSTKLSNKFQLIYIHQYLLHKPHPFWVNYFLSKRR